MGKRQRKTPPLRRSRRACQFYKRETRGFLDNRLPKEKGVHGEGTKKATDYVISFLGKEIFKIKRS